MKAKSLVALLTVACVLWPSIAQADPRGKTSWKAETNGSPVATEFGQWMESSDGRTVDLQFTGGHLIGSGTTFKARWLSPYTSIDERPRFDGEWELENHNYVGDDIKIRSKFRFRLRNGEWYPWLKINKTFKPGGNFMWVGEVFRGHARQQVQFEWRLAGEIKAPTYLEGYARLSIN